jgi:putative transcriptional regulator
MVHSDRDDFISTPDSNNDSGFKGRLLLAMPQMEDERFDRAVILLCAHDANGAMGLVLNNAIPGVDLGSLFQQLDIDAAHQNIEKIPVLSGGPVEGARGFVLHSPDFKHDETVSITDEMSVTGTLDALRAIAAGQGPQELKFMLGYAGWSAGQLDEEIQFNSWLITDASADLIFNTKAEDIWAKAIATMGIDPAMLSMTSGRA